MLEDLLMSNDEMREIQAQDTCPPLLILLAVCGILREYPSEYALIAKHI
ncbi:MAG TPA: hypothetical protein VEL70_00240 [Candidatus Acidoferrum sp.]|nr:hypothetical protein [Candidatus Acidoferrum sp.]